MLDQKQAVARLRRAFPQLERYPNAPPGEEPGCSSLDAFDFARFVIGLYENRAERQIRLAFTLMEMFLCDGEHAVRDWVGRSIETLHDLAAWKPCGREVFVEFQGGETSRIWTALNQVWEASVGSDFRDASVFESEIAAWHVVRDAVRQSPRAAATSFPS